MDYLYIRAWGIALDSFLYYIEDQVERARRDHAPETAIYRRQDGSWAVFEEIPAGNFKGHIAALVELLRPRKEG